MSSNDISFIKDKAEENVNGVQKIKYKDAVKWIVIDLNSADSNWIVRTHESQFSDKTSVCSSRMSVLSGLSDLSDVSGITELKA